MAERRRTSRKRVTPPPFASTDASTEEVEAVGKWRRRVARAQTLRQEWEETYQLDELALQFLGTPNVTLESLDNPVNINRFWPTLRAQLPSLFFQNPTFFVDPIDKRSSPSQLRMSAMAEAVLKTIALQDFHFRDAIRLALLQAFFSIGVVKIVYDPRLVKNPEAGQLQYLTDGEGFAVRDDVGDPVVLRDDDGTEMVEPAEIVSDET